MVVRLARQFDLVCDSLEEFDDAPNFIAPLTANSALTCELYLKALYHISNPDLPNGLSKPPEGLSGERNLRKLFKIKGLKKGHDLKELYGRQSKAVQDSVYEEYERLFLNRDAPSNLIGTLDREAFLSHLDKVKDVFKNSRYAYETPGASVQPGILLFLRKALRKVTIQVYDQVFF